MIGTGERAARAIRSIQRAGHLGYRPAAVLATDLRAASSDLEGVPIVGGLDQAGTVASHGVRVALLEIDQFVDPTVVDRMLRHFQHVVVLRAFDDLPVEGIQIRNLGDVVGIGHTNNLLLHANRVAKRAMDVVVGGLALVVAAPAIICAAALVRLLDGAPSFFTQDRQAWTVAVLLCRRFGR